MIKPSKLTCGANVIFESSRFVLPEHREKALQYSKEMTKKVRPELDECRLQDISYSIGESMSENSPSTFVLFCEYGEREITGTVIKVDQQLRQIKVAISTDEWEWIKIKDIIGVK
ncbi:YolD-like family protein [Paenibacillus cremeus]|uniref:YolD-like family protein n=1 Tax=Paenibacillus cremeus TaxID=2163881 RepID=A0A559K350_9BACL|nr:YolD-like family protein [Paenibacillus cremeus]TVY06571.1 YolD-like family protein [Paenibacillus cremeus]